MIGRRPDRLRGRLVARSELGAACERMLGVLRESFDGVTRATFERDLEGKDWAILLEDERGVLQGFSTLAFYPSVVRGEALDVVCSGDTIVRPSAWGSSALPRAWIAAVETLRARHPGRRTLWLLLASGYRTYRFLPVFWRRFHPCPDDETPRETRAVLDHLARERWGELYDARSGIVRFPRPQVLRSSLRGVPAPRRSDPHVAFFLERNPGCSHGDELVCLADLSRGNLTRLGRRMLASAEPGR